MSDGHLGFFCAALARHRSDAEREMAALRRETAVCMETVLALAACLEDARIIVGATLAVKVHRRRFQAASLRHPLRAVADGRAQGNVGMDAILCAQGSALTVALGCGWHAVRNASATCHAVRRAFKPDGCTSQHIRSLLPSRIYVFGGSKDGDGALDTAECFSTGSLSWEALPCMGSARFDASASALFGQLYVCGGCLMQSALQSDVRSVLNSVERFDPGTGSWQRMPSMLFPRRSAAAGVAGGRLYVCGGYDASERTLDLSECFDPRHGATWEALPLMLESRAEPAAGTVGGRLFVCGGRGGGGWKQLNSVERLDPEDSLWQEMPPMLENRSGAAAAPLGGRLFVCGGMGNNVSSLVESFDVAAGIWEAMPPMSVGRYGGAAATASGLLYVLGGTSALQDLDSAERYDPEARAWRTLESMRERRIGPAVAACLA